MALAGFGIREVPAGATISGFVALVVQPDAATIRAAYALAAALRGTPVPLRTVVAFGGGFLFWCVEDASPARALLQRAHEHALGVADGVLDPVVNVRVVEGTKKGTGDDPVLVGHAERYGVDHVLGL